MRIPEKPPDQNDQLLENMKLDDIPKLVPYMRIVNNDYLHWDEIKIDGRFKDIELTQLWAFAKITRDSTTRDIKLGGVNLKYVQTPNIEKTLHDLDMRIGGKLYLVSNIHGSDLQKKYLVNSLMEEAIASSQLEGAATTRKVAKQMLRENREPRNKSERMIVNNYLTMMHIKEIVDQKQILTLDFIKDIHKKITKNTLEITSYEGVFRTDNEIEVIYSDGTVVHKPPDFNNISKLLESVCNFINSESELYYLHPFVKAIILHYMIGYIHPFNDGNGRTARALFYWYLISQKYEYIEYVAVSTAIKNAPAQYVRAYLYAETDGDDVTYFVKFNLDKLGIALDSFENYIKKTMVENDRTFDAVKRNPELNLRQVDILINLNKYGNEKPITISQMQEIYHTTYQTARTDLLGLAKKGYLRQFIAGKQFLFHVNKTKMEEFIFTINKDSLDGE